MMMGEVDPLGLNAPIPTVAEPATPAPITAKINDTTKTLSIESKDISTTNALARQIKFDEKWDDMQEVIQDKCSIAGKIRFALDGIEDDPKQRRRTRSFFFYFDGI